MARRQTFGLVTLGDKGRIVLPDAVRRLLDLHSGDYLLVEGTERGSIELVPADLVPRDQRWFAHPEMQARVAQAEAAIAEAKVTPVPSIEEARAYLDRLKSQGEKPAEFMARADAQSGEAARPPRRKTAGSRKATAS